MKVGIVAEGRGDIAVIINILKGKLGINKSDIKPLRPEYQYDQTDLAQMPDNFFSNWTLVKEKCINNEDLEIFLSLNDNAFLVIQIDTAERGEKGYEVFDPNKKDLSHEDYCISLRYNVIDKIKSWMNNQLDEQIAYAICIEETEAWILTLYDQHNTSNSANPKEKLNNILPQRIANKDRHILSEKDEFKKMSKLSEKFSKKKELNQAIQKNKSLYLFCASLEKFHSKHSNN